MGMDTKLKDGTQYLDKYNWAPGMNDDLAYADRAGYNTSVEMLTSGSTHDWNDFGSLEVGGAYELDPMGEVRGDQTFSDSDPVAAGFIGKLATAGAGQQDTQTTVSGKKVNLSSPQTYNSIGLSKKGE